MAADIANELKNAGASAAEDARPRADALAIVTEALKLETQAILQSEKKGTSLSIRRHRVDFSFNQVSGFP